MNQLDVDDIPFNFYWRDFYATVLDIDCGAHVVEFSRDGRHKVGDVSVDPENVWSTQVNAKSINDYIKLNTEGDRKF